MNKFELYYFSGTGNSLHIAKELQKRIPDATLIPIISLLKKETIKTNAEVVGIVFPLYLTTVPKPVDEFIKKLDINSAKYTFSVVTRIGTFSVANVYINKVLKKSGKLLPKFCTNKEYVICQLFSCSIYGLATMMYL